MSQLRFPSTPTVASLTLLFALAAAVLPFAFRGNHLAMSMDALLPKDPWIRAHLDFLRNSRIGAIAAVSLDAGRGADPAKLPEFAARFAELAEKEPSVKSVFFKIPPGEALAALGFLSAHMPQVFNPRDLALLEKRTSRKSLDFILRGHYRDLTRPGAVFRQKLFASDPLNLHEIIINKLRSLAGGSGFKVRVRENGLWSEDGRHLLVLVGTDAPISDAGRGEAFVKALERCLEKARPSPSFKYIIMAGHRHAVDNRRLLRRDIAVTMGVAAAGFILLFAFLFRDWRAMFVFAVPFVGMAAAVGLTWLFFDGPSAVILGMGATVIGIALDYGIHVFVAAKDALSVIQPQVEPAPIAPSRSEVVRAIDASVSRVARPIVFSALTTLGVFWAFFLSSSPGYHQLAFASTCGVALSVWISLTCLPLVFKIGVPKPGGRPWIAAKLAGAFGTLQNRPASRSILFACLAAVAVSVFFATWTGFQPNIRSLDGISDALRRDEREFRGIWGESSQAAVSVKARSFETAMEIQDAIAETARKAGIPGFKSLSIIWPSLKTRKENAAAWDAFWSDERISDLKRDLRDIGAKYSFSDRAFESFFKVLTARKHDFSADFAESPGFGLFRGKFGKIGERETRLDAFFKDDPADVAKLKRLLADKPNVSVVSPRRFGEYISESIMRDARKVALFALPIVILLAWFCLRSPRNVMLALLPVLAAVAAEFPAHAVAGLKLNAISLVAMIVVTGLAVDYGIFAVAAADKRDARFSENAVTSLTISMLTTAVGSGALLFAAHPALRSVGLVVTVGVAAAWASAVFAVPALWRCEDSKDG